MGRVEWQTGEVTLPSGALPAVKKALRDATNALHAQAKTAAADFWDNYAKHTRSERLYKERLDVYQEAQKRAASSHYGPSYKHPSGLEWPLSEQLFWMLEGAAAHPHKLTAAEVDSYFPRATNRTERFEVGEGGVGFHGRRLSWSTGHNKNVVEEFGQHPVGEALHTALSKVVWTRGTGGHSWGSDEYAEDAARESGYNPVSTQGSWGPLGAAHHEAERRALYAQISPSHRRAGSSGRRI